MLLSCLSPENELSFGVLRHLDSRIGALDVKIYNPKKKKKKKYIYIIPSSLPVVLQSSAL